MKLNFTKHIIKYDTPLHGGGYRDDRHYKVFDNGNHVGTFYCSGSVASFKYDSHEFIIDIRKHFFRRSEYYIVNKATNERVAEYDISSIRISWEKNIGTLIYNNTAYQAERAKPEIRYNIFKRSTWGHYKVKLGNTANEITYSVNFNSRSHAAQLEFTPCEGQIETSAPDMFLVLSGLFLLEKFFHELDVSSET